MTGAHPTVARRLTAPSPRADVVAPIAPPHLDNELDSTFSATC